MDVEVSGTRNWYGSGRGASSESGNDEGIWAGDVMLASGKDRLSWHDDLSGDEGFGELEAEST